MSADREASAGRLLRILLLRLRSLSPQAVTPVTEATVADRPELVRRGLALNYLTLAYNTLEAIVSLAAGLVAGSVALVGFGVDSGIEVTASIAAQWRLRSDFDHARRERVGLATRRVIGASFRLASTSRSTVWRRSWVARPRSRVRRVW